MTKLIAKTTAIINITMINIPSFVLVSNGCGLRPAAVDAIIVVVAAPTCSSFGNFCGDRVESVGEGFEVTPVGASGCTFGDAVVNVGEYVLLVVDRVESVGDGVLIVGEDVAAVGKFVVVDGANVTEDSVGGNVGGS